MSLNNNTCGLSEQFQLCGWWVLVCGCSVCQQPGEYSTLAGQDPVSALWLVGVCLWLHCLCQQPGEYSILADQNRCPLGMMVYQGARQLLHKYSPLQAPLPPLQCRNDSVVGAHARRVLQNGYGCSKVGFRLLYLGSRTTRRIIRSLLMQCLRALRLTGRNHVKGYASMRKPSQTASCGAHVMIK